MNEQDYDKLLNVKTIGDQEGFHSSFHYHRYEPTPYFALEKLFKEYEVKSSDYIVDYGCGKGRLNFYLHYFFHSSVIGIEMNEHFLKEAMENRKNYFIKHKKGKGQLEFHHCLAEEYEIDPKANRFYFFNPFSIQIFIHVVNNILRSIECSPREVELILYYGSDDYVYFLENQTLFELKQEVVLPGRYERNSHERFLIYRLV